MSENRIGSPCWYKVKKEDRWKMGRVRAWSTDHIEYESGPGHYPVAVIEDDKTLACLSIPVGNVSFASDPQ